MALPASVQELVNDFSQKLSQAVLTNDYPGIQVGMTNLLDSLIGSENFWDRDIATTTISQHTAGDSLSLSAGGDLTVVAGDIEITAGDLTLGNGDALLSGGNLTVAVGDLLLSSGDLDMTLGNFTMDNGDLTITSGDLSLVAGAIDASGGIVSTTGNVGAVAGNLSAGQGVFAKSIKLDNGGTDGGSIYFNADDAYALANALKVTMNAHAADGVEHKHGGVASPDTVNFPVATPNAIDLATLLVLASALRTAYTGHNTDATLGAPVFHNATAAAHALAWIAPTNLHEAILTLNEIKTQYNLHDTDVAGHTTGSTHQEMVSNITLSSIEATAAGAIAAYVGEAGVGSILSQVLEINPADVFWMQSQQVDGAGNIAFELATQLTLADPAAILFQLDNNTTDVVRIGIGGLIDTDDGFSSTNGDVTLTNGNVVVGGGTLVTKRAKATLDYSNISGVAAFTGTFGLFTMSAGSVVRDVYANLTTEFGDSPAAPLAATVDGTAGGIITFALAPSLSGFSVGNYVAIDDDAEAEVHGYIVAITDLGGPGPYEVHIQDAPGGAGADVDLSAFAVADNAVMYVDLSAMTVEVGIVGDTDKYLAAGRDVFTAPAAFIGAADKGTALTTPGLTSIESFTGSVNIVAKFDTTGALLNQLSSGVIDFYIEYTEIL